MLFGWLFQPRVISRNSIPFPGFSSGSCVLLKRMNNLVFLGFFLDSFHRSPSEQICCYFLIFSESKKDPLWYQVIWKTLGNPGFVWGTHFGSFWSSCTIFSLMTRERVGQDILKFLIFFGLIRTRLCQFFAFPLWFFIKIFPQISTRLWFEKPNYCDINLIYFGWEFVVVLSAFYHGAISWQ